MYARAIPILGFSCLAVLAAYLLGIATTVFFATWQTDLSRSIRDLEGSVITLEAEYYDAVKRFSAADPAALGYAAPRSVEYVTATGVSVLSRADQ